MEKPPRHADRRACARSAARRQHSMTLVSLSRVAAVFAQKRAALHKPVLISTNKPDLSLISLGHTLWLCTPLISSCKSESCLCQTASNCWHKAFGPSNEPMQLHKAKLPRQDSISGSPQTHQHPLGRGTQCSTEINIKHAHTLNVLTLYHGGC